MRTVEMRTIRTKGLPGSSDHTEAVYTFILDDRSRPPILHIPGESRGPDICIPESSEQERWLDGRSHILRRTWDCQWTFQSDRSVEEFLLLLGPFELAGPELPLNIE
jgi:hypothetical protein